MNENLIYEEKSSITLDPFKPLYMVLEDFILSELFIMLN